MKINIFSRKGVFSKLLIRNACNECLKLILNFVFKIFKIKENILEISLKKSIYTFITIIKIAYQRNKAD